jgi:acetyl esterase/lipase/hemerythrin-like domain-containing protein
VGIIDTLYSEHGYILNLLNSLEKQAEKLKPGKVPDYQLLLELVDYLVHYPGEFHHPREDLLFGALLKKDKKLQPRIDRLMREHETLGQYNDQIFNELTAIVNGRRADQPALYKLIGKLIKGYRLHISYESREIFPLAKGTLSAAQLKKIEAKTRYIDDPLFGVEVKRQYRRVGRNLQAALGGASEFLLEKEVAGIEPAIEKVAVLVNKLNEMRESAKLPGPRFLRSRLKGAGLCSRAGKRPSWQAQVMNLCTRSFMKPMMRYGSVEGMRGMLDRVDSQGERLLPEDVSARLVKKKGYEGEWVRIAGKRPRKTILYFPGGGFIMRTPTQHKGMVAKICREANAKALIVHYSLAPEIPFPGGLEDCLAAYHDLLDSGIKAEDITVAGDSAGGGLVLSTLLALRDEGTELPGNAIVLSPLADLTYSGGSREFNKDKDPMLPTHRASQMHELYIGEALPEDRFISPVFADFDGLPPILGQVGSTEILLDDTVRAAAKAEECGVPFFLEVWEQLPHVFPMFGVLPEAQVAIERMAEFINTNKLDPLSEEYSSEEFCLA